MKNEIFPNIERIEDKDFAFTVEKLRQCADLGLFLAEIPEAYGGLELEKTTNMLMIEKVAPATSFCMAFQRPYRHWNSAHGLLWDLGPEGTLPG